MRNETNISKKWLYVIKHNQQKYWEEILEQITISKLFKKNQICLVVTKKIFKNSIVLTFDKISICNYKMFILLPYNVGINSCDQQLYLEFWVSSGYYHYMGSRRIRSSYEEWWVLNNYNNKNKYIIVRQLYDGASLI